MLSRRINLFILFVCLLSVTLLIAVPGDAMAGKYLLVWASDKGTDDGHQDPDFLAVIDATPGSATYGKVVNTASLPCINGAHLLDELGMVPGLSSCLLNEAHHATGELFVEPATGHKFLFVAGLISANIFRFDVTDPLHIPPATLVVTSRDVKQFAGPDDLLFLPNGHIIATFMGSKGLQTPGGLVEFSPQGAKTFIAEYRAARAGGPKRYVPSIYGVTDTGLLAHPHGIALRPDLNLLVTSDYADPMSLAKIERARTEVADFGTTVRIWQLSNLAAGPTQIVQVPDGPRREKTNKVHEEPEGLMSVAMLHERAHRGVFTASMCGGVLYYTPDATVSNPGSREVYDTGPCTGASVFTITQDDSFLIMPIAGVQSPGDGVYNRDYVGEHARRVVVLDIRPLLNSGTGPIRCGPPDVKNDPDGWTIGLNAHNNGAPDCPVEVANINVDSPVNFSTNGGPHLVILDKDETRLAFDNYFVDLKNFKLPGTGSGGDLKIYMANFDKKTGALALDGSFRDELTGEVGVNFNRPTTYSWPGDRGTTGAAKPHALIFVNTERDD